MKTYVKVHSLTSESVQMSDGRVVTVIKPLKQEEGRRRRRRKK